MINICAKAITSLALLVMVITATAQEKTKHIFLLRHAEKATDGTQDPALSPAGAAYADQLSTLLSRIKIDAVFATPYKRTIMTATPVAAANNVEIKQYDPFNPKALLAQIEASQAENIVVVGHANTVPQLINYLIPSAGMKDLNEQDQGLLFIINYHKSYTGSNSYTILNTIP